MEMLVGCEPSSDTKGVLMYTREPSVDMWLEHNGLFLFKLALLFLSLFHFALCLFLVSRRVPLSSFPFFLIGSIMNIRPCTASLSLFLVQSYCAGFISFHVI